ncbi:hypothetical protein [Mycolicibacterium tokaiense]|uniref:hypothetical protein n=1 Tax=Mycolicibacterium tokaiense TaxID=39695 RepID=UPI0015593119|nr:hypothetical protein [Mycolicibacterium tokaiense]
MTASMFRTVLAAGLIGLATLGTSGVAHAELFGDPDGMAGWTVEQAYNDCALMAASDVIGQMTGWPPTRRPSSSSPSTPPASPSPVT